MLQLRALSTLLLVVLCAGPLGAQGPEPGDVLTVDVAVRRALEANRLLQIAQSEVDGLGDRIAAVRTRKYPHLSTRLLEGAFILPLEATFPAGAFGSFGAIGPFPPTDTTPGLGALTPPDLAALFAGRRPLGAEAIGAGGAAWAAYASPEPTAVESLLAADAALPFVSGAARCHLGRLPSTRDGLNETERAVLTALRDGPLVFAALFARVAADPAIRRHGAGDVQLAGLLREMRAGPRPLVAVHDAERAPGDWTLAMTPAGRDVLARRTDRLACSPVDRWLGGVHLAPGRRTWRWDGERVVGA